MLVCTGMRWEEGLGAAGALWEGCKTFWAGWFVLGVGYCAVLGGNFGSAEPQRFGPRANLKVAELTGLYWEPAGEGLRDLGMYWDTVLGVQSLLVYSGNWWKNI